MKKKSFFFFIFLVVIAIGEVYWLSDLSNSNDKKERKKYLSPETMQKDISYYFSQLRAIHPNLYQKYNSDEFFKIEDKLKRECCFPKTRVDFELLLSKVQYLLDGHTGIIAKELYKFSQKKKFPYVCFKSSYMLLNEDTLLTIGNKSCAEITSILDSMISWEYSRKRREVLKNELLNILLSNNNIITYPILCTCKREGGTGIDTMIVEGELISCFKDYLGRPVSSKYYCKPFDSVFYHKEKIGVLYYNTSDFKLESDYQAFVKFINDFFWKMECDNFQVLFIDVTQNGGGRDDLHNYIFSRLNHKETHFIAHLSSKKEAIKKYIEYLKKKQNNKLWVEKVGKMLLKEGVVSMPYHYSSVRNQFRGSVFVVGGNKTYSAAFDFCAFVKRLQSGKLVGEEIGQRFPFCGNVLIDVLPHSGISFQVPTTFYWETPALPLKEGYLQPDIYYSLDSPLQLKDFNKIISINQKKDN